MAKPTRKPKATGADKKQRPSLPLSRPCTPDDIIDRARQYGPACVDTLADIAANGDTSASRVSAVNALLDRGFGKPRQPIQLTGKDGGPLEMAHGVSPALAEALATLRGGNNA